MTLKTKEMSCQLPVQHQLNTNTRDLRLQKHYVFDALLHALILLNILQSLFVAYLLLK